MMKAYTKTLLAIGLLSSTTAFAAYTNVSCKVEMDRDVLFANQKQTAIVKVTLDAPDAPQTDERPAVNLTIVLDRSGSMSGQNIEKAKEAAITALRRLAPKDLFSLVTYDSRVQTVVPSQSASNADRIEKQIRKISTGGNTALFAGVSQGASEIRKNINNEYIHRILLLSDGMANNGPSSPDELGRLGTALRKEGISVTTIGVGTSYNEDLMTRMAQNSDGNTYFVEASADLPRIFNRELGDVLSVVASDVKINVTFPAGVKPVRIIGRDGQIGEDTVAITLNQLYGGQQKYALIEVEIPASSNGDVRKIADATCSYQDRIQNKTATSTGFTTVRFSNETKTVNENVNIAVSREVLQNVIAIAREDAVNSADKKDYDQAAAVLISNAKIVAKFADDYDDAELKEEAVQIQEQADEIQKSQLLPKRSRKKMKTKSFFIFNQQRSTSSYQEQDD